MPPFMSFLFNTETEWHKQQVEHLSDALAELLSGDDPHLARKALSKAIESWTDYHKKELEKWQTLRNLLSL
jgi:flagellar motor component MotA